MLFNHLSYLLIYTKMHKNWKQNKRNGMVNDKQRRKRESCFFAAAMAGVELL